MLKMARKCPYCGRTFKTEKGMKIHVAKAHSNKKESKEKIKPGEILIKNSKAGRKMAVLRLNLDKDKDLEELRIYLGGSKSKRTKPARVFDKKELIY